MSQTGFNSGVSKPHIQFQEKQKWFKAFNFILLAWALSQTILYFVASAKTQCSQVNTLLIGYALSEVTFLVAISGALISSFLYKYFTANYFLDGFCIIAKSAVIISLIFYAWSGFTDCYISFSIKATIISTNALQILIASILIIILKRIKKAHRQIKIQKLVQSKTFAQY